MAINRKKIGILFNFSPRWMGGVVYVLNIVKVLNFLEDKDKPMVYVFYNPNLEKFLKEIDYPYLETIKRPYPSVKKAFISSLFTGKNIFVDDIIRQYSLDALFPLHDIPVKNKTNCSIVAWYADLQHKHYPQFFSAAKRFERNLRIKYILKNADKLVVSSNAVKDDFEEFFKLSRNTNFEVYHFVSVIDNFPEYSFEKIKTEYKLPGEYFIISNQFHKHKNHKVAFEAIAALKKKNVFVNLVLTGKLPDDDESEYVTELKAIIKKNELSDQILFLGVMPRDIQLSVMQYARAVIQPSLFEGWSTVIEDAKSLQVPVIASDLKVNIEQLQERGTYFKPHDELELASILENYPKNDYTKQYYEEYGERMKKAASELLAIFKK